MSTINIYYTCIYVVFVVVFIAVSTGLGIGKPHLTPLSPYYYSTRLLRSRITGVVMMVG